MPKGDWQYLICPACGGNRPQKALILCRRCWAQVPDALRLQVHEARRKDPQSVVVTELAGKLISAAVKMR